MNNRILGAVGFMAFIFLAIFFAINQEGVNASLLSFFSALETVIRSMGSFLL